MYGQDPCAEFPNSYYSNLYFSYMHCMYICTHICTYTLVLNMVVCIIHNYFLQKSGFSPCARYMHENTVTGYKVQELCFSEKNMPHSENNILLCPQPDAGFSSTFLNWQLRMYFLLILTECLFYCSDCIWLSHMINYILNVTWEKVCCSDCSWLSHMRNCILNVTWEKL